MIVLSVIVIITISWSHKIKYYFISFSLINFYSVILPSSTLIWKTAADPGIIANSPINVSNVVSNSWPNHAIVVIFFKRIRHINKVIWFDHTTGQQNTCKKNTICSFRLDQFFFILPARNIQRHFVQYYWYENIQQQQKKNCSVFSLYIMINSPPPKSTLFTPDKKRKVKETKKKKTKKKAPYVLFPQSNHNFLTLHLLLTLASFHVSHVNFKRSELE